VQHEYSKKIKSYDLKISHYKEVAKQLSLAYANKVNPEEFCLTLNETLILSSDNVVREVLNFNKLYTEKKEKVKKEGRSTIEITKNDIKPLFIAIREELNLTSKSIEEMGLNFFQILK